MRTKLAVAGIALAALVAAQAMAQDPGAACALMTVRGTCNGVSGYPVRFDASSPNGVSSLCPPYNNPFVVFSPHPDDETLATAGAIRAAKDAGRQVIIELMTNGDQSRNCPAGTSGPSGSCGPARCREFMSAMQALGVDGVVVNNYGDTTLLNGWASSSCVGASGVPPDPAKAPQRVQFWKSMVGTSNIIGQLSLRGTVGFEDGDENGNSICHADHLAVRLALQNANHPDTKWYSVYLHAYSGRHGTTGIMANYNHEYASASQCNPYILGALNAYINSSTRYGYLGAIGAFDNEVSDCNANQWDGLALKTSGACPEGTCVPPDGDYISHFTGLNCDGTEMYYLAYDGFAYKCRPDPSTGAQCGTTPHSVTTYSYRYGGVCYANAWPSGNPLNNLVYVYRNLSGSCPEGNCVQPDGDYISHFTGANCDGTESYYLPYDNFAYKCRPDPSSGAQCGTIHRTVTNRSYRYLGQCHANAWPNGNTLSDFVTVYH